MPQQRAAPRPKALIRLLNLLLRHAGVLSAVLGVMVLLSQLHMALLLAPLKPHVLALQLAFSAQRFWQIVAQWGPQGLQLYRDHFPYDLPHTLLYGAWGAAMVVGSRLFEPWSSRRRWAMAALLPAAAVFDLLENAAHLALLAGPPARNSLLVPWGASFSLLKWVLVLTYLAVLLWRCLRAYWPRMAPTLELRLPPLALVLLCGAGLGVMGWWRPAWRHAVPWAWPVGLALAGLGLVAMARHALRQAGTTLNPMQPQQTRRLVTEGVYGFSRHPMYLGLALLVAAGALWLGQLAGAVAPLVTLAWLHRFQVVPEERALAASFGPAFTLYSVAVRRWV